MLVQGGGATEMPCLEVAPLADGVTPKPNAPPSLYALEPLLPRPAHNAILNATVTLTREQISLHSRIENTVGVFLQPSFKKKEPG